MWNKKINEKISYLIDNYANKGEYAVFDCDNTILMNDVQFALTYYILKKKKLALNPKELENFINKHFFKDEILEDFINLYKKAYFKDENSIEYLEFLANFERVIEYVYHKYDHFDLTLAFAFNNLNKEELEKLVEESIDFHSKLDFGIDYFNFEDEVSVYKTGLKISDEMAELIKNLYENGIDVYVISASTKYEVEVVLKPLKKYISKIFAKELNEIDNRFDGSLDKSKIIPVAKGKKEIIEKFLIPKYKKEPLIVAGDSIGDYEMLTSFKNTKLSLIINRNRKGKFKELLSIKDDRFLVQSVDEKKGIFIDTENSITF